MPLRSLLPFLRGCAAWLHITGACLAQDRQSVSEYQRPDLGVQLFDTTALALSGEQKEAILRELNLISRNFGEAPAVTQRIRSRALGLALRLSPGDRTAVVANGQLARGVRPVPLPCETTPTPSGTAARLSDIARPLVHSASNATRQLGLLLCDLSLQLESRLRRRTAQFTYLASPDWHDAAPAPPPEAGHAFTLRESSARLILPVLKDGRTQTFTVTASAAPVKEKSGLRVQLPDAVLEAMKHPGTGGALRAAAEERMACVRTALRQRHDVWPDGWVVHFQSGAAADAVPQLFAGIAVTLDSLLAGEPLDPGLTVAAALDGSGRLQAVIPPADLFRTWALEPLPPLILPASVATDVADWLLLNPDQWPLFFRVPLYSAADLTDLLDLARASRAPRLAQSCAAFESLAEKLRSAPDPLTEIRKPECLSALREITTWHPRHFSAAMLLAVAAPAPATLSLRGSLTQIDTLAAPILSTDRKRYPLHQPRGTFERTDFVKAADALQAARFLHPATRPYVSELLTLAKMLDRAYGSWRAYLKDNGPPDPPDITSQRNAAAAVRATLRQAGE